MLKRRVVHIVLAVIFLAGCQTAQRPPPRSDATLSTQQLVGIIDKALHGPAPERRDVAGLISRSDSWSEANRILIGHLSKPGGKDDLVKVAVDLYGLGPAPEAARVFTLLIARKSVDARKAAWQLAAQKPSAAMGQAVERELSQRLSASRGGKMVIPTDITHAIRANDMKEAYSLMRQGLMQDGHPEFARTMIALNPDRAADDLLSFLVEISPASLQRAGSLIVKRQTCLIAIAHFRDNLPSTLNPNFERLFLFAIAKDPALSSAALSVLAGHMPAHSEDFATAIQRLPKHAQVRFAERLRQSHSEAATLLAKSMAATSGDAL